MGLLIFLAAIGIVTLVFAFYSYRICFHSPKRRKPEDLELHIPKGEQYEAVRDRMLAAAKRMQDAPCQWFSIQSHDHRTLWARYYENRPDAPVMLFFHGYRGHCCRDCAGGFAIAKKLGFNILAVDQRSHGRSDGRVITFGIRERQDCLRWIQWIKEKFGTETPIILSGVSMGAATVLMASELELTDSVSCILADCPYSTPSAIIRKVSRDVGYPDKIAYPFILLGAGIFGGFRLNECSAVAAVKNAKVPILLIHGEDDRFVPCDMSREIRAGCEDRIQLHTFPDAGHGLSYLTDPRRYEKICVDFLWQLPALENHLQRSEFATDLHSA